VLSCTREIEIDLVMLSGSGGLKPGTSVGLVAGWWSEGTTLRGQGEPVYFILGTTGGRRRFELEVNIPGGEAAYHVQLRSALILGTAGPAMRRDRLAPHREGSILWEDSIGLTLEADAPRFPISVVDFVDDGIGPANACWKFEWSPVELGLPAMATMRLLVNARHEIFRQALIATEPLEAQIAIRSALKHALMMEMLQLALLHADELETGQPFEVGSAGRVFTDLIARVFPGHSPRSCAEFRHAQPGRFSAEVQGKVDLFPLRGSQGVVP
jgi:hypothetical protein